MIEGSFLLMKTFNINASCNPDIHYMADITPGLEIIKSMVDKGQYFTIKALYDLPCLRETNFTSK